MNKLSKLLVLVLFVVLGIVLVGCTGTDTPPEPEKIAPTAITVDATIYSGSDTEKYVLVGNKMYVEAEVEGPEGADETVEWSIEGAAATLEVEDGVAVVTGVKGGNATVTAKSTLDANVKGSYVVEVVDSEDFNEVVVAAKDEVLAKLPEFATADFALPQPSNPNVKLTYMSKLKKTWADGTFKFSDAYNAKNGDSLYVFYGTFQFHGVKKEFEFSIKCVGNATNNDFTALATAKAQVEAIFAETKDITGSFKNMIENSDGSFTLKLPEKIKVDGYDQDIAVEWALESGNGLTIKYDQVEETVKDADGNDKLDKDGKPVKVTLNVNPRLIYSKPLVDSQCQVNAIYKAKNNNNDISKLFLTAIGYTPDEVWEFFKLNNFNSKYYQSATDTFKTNLKGFTVPTVDAKKKFRLLTVEYEVLEGSESVLSYTAPSAAGGNGTFRKEGTGEAQVKITLYYNKSERTVKVDKFDENGNLVKDADGNVVQEEVKQIVCDWSKEFVVTFTVE